MRTFCEFVEQRDKVSNIFESIAIEAEYNPEFNKILIQEGWWDTMKDVGTGIKNFAQGAWSGGGIKTGAKTAWSAMTGPATQMRNASESLNKTYQQIMKNPQWATSRTKSGDGELHAWLKHTIGELEHQIGQFQNLQNPGPAQTAPVATPAPAHAPGTPGYGG